MIGLGLLEFLSGQPTGLWLALIGFFIVMAAGSQAVGAQIQAALSGVHASDLMSTPVISIPERTSALQATTDYFVPYRYTAFPVVDDRGRATGLLSIGLVDRLTRSQRAAQWVADVADHDPSLLVARGEDVARVLERPAFARVGRAAVVDEDGAPIGLLSITDVQRALRAARIAEPAGGGHAGVSR